jgi:hypothetical protein
MSSEHSEQGLTPVCAENVVRWLAEVFGGVSSDDRVPTPFSSHCGVAANVEGAARGGAHGLDVAVFVTPLDAG